MKQRLEQQKTAALQKVQAGINLAENANRHAEQKVAALEAKVRQWTSRLNRANTTLKEDTLAWKLKVKAEADQQDILSQVC